MLSRAEDNDEGVSTTSWDHKSAGEKNRECWEICHVLSYSNNDGISYEIIKVFPCMRLKF